MEEKVYKVKVSEDGRSSPVAAFRGTWDDCKKFAYSYMSLKSPFNQDIQLLEASQGLCEIEPWRKDAPHIHVQGDASKPGYVGYGHAHGGYGQFLWVLITDTNPPPEPEREPFDYNASINTAIDYVLATLPQNIKDKFVQVYQDTKADTRPPYEAALTHNERCLWEQLLEKSGEPNGGHSGASYGFAAGGTIARVVGFEGGK